MGVKKTLILLAGKASSGKDTVASHLISKYSFTRFAFADALKDYISYKFNIDKHIMYSQQGKKQRYLNTEFTIRDLLINEGCAKRQEDPNYWIKIILKKIQECQGNVVISDFRFPNEYDFLVENLINTHNIKTINIIRENGAEIIDDISETSLNNFKFDKIIFNDRSLSDLYHTVDNDLNDMNIN